MKAIKQNNGSIITSNGYPKAFNGIYNYDKLFTEEQYKAHGWKDLVIPDYNKSTHRLGKIKYDNTNDNYYYEVIQITTEEAQSKEYLFYKNRIELGKEIHSKISAKLRVMKLQGVLTEQNHSRQEDYLNNILNQIIRGQLLTAKKLANSLEPKIINQDIITLINNLLNEAVLKSY